MAADLRALMQSVYDFFLQMYQAGGTDDQSGAFLAFEKIGHPVLPSDFKLNPVDGDFSPGIARERTSQLGNSVPQVFDNFATPTDRLVDDTYSMLLIGAMPNGTPDEITFCSNLKAEANKRMANQSLESLLGMSSYHPCDPTPVDWYDPAKAASWPNFTKKAEPPAATPTPPAHPVRFNLAWKLEPPPAQITSVLARRSLISTPAIAVAPQAMRVDAVKRTMLTHMTLTPMGGLAATRIATPAVSAAAVEPAVETAPAIKAFAPTVALPMRAVLLRDLVAVAPEKPVNSDQFSLSFSYCIVRLQRPWLFQPFLDCKSWYVPGYPQGAFSSGPEEGNSGLFANVPLAFLLIKDLSIAANWTQEDTAAAQGSLALPPFSLVGSTFQSNTLSSPGMQIIAWIVQPMPLLPPQSAPA